MKKTLLALSVVASFSTFAADDFDVYLTDINKQIKEHGLTVDNKGMVTDADGNYVADATFENGSIRLENSKEGKAIDVDVASGSGVYMEDGYMANVVVIDDTNWKPNNDVIANTVRASDIFKSVDRIDAKEDEFGRHAIYGKDGDYIGGAVSGDGYTIITNEKTGDTVRINEKTGEYTYWDADNNESKGYIDNDVTVDPIDPVDPSNGRKPIYVDPTDPKKPNGSDRIKPANKPLDVQDIVDSGAHIQEDKQGNKSLYVKNSDGSSIYVGDVKELGDDIVIKNGNENAHIDTKSGKYSYTDAEGKVHDGQIRDRNGIVTEVKSNNVVKVSDIVKSIGRIDTEEDEYGRNAVYDVDGNYVGGAISGDGYTTISNEKTGDTVRINEKTGEYTYWDADNNESNGYIDNNIVEPVEPQDPSEVIDRVAKNLDVKEEGNGVYSINKGEHAGTRINSNTGEVTNVRGDKIGQIKVDDAGNVIVEERSGNSGTPVKPAGNVIDDAANAISAEVDKRIAEAGASVEQDASRYANTVDLNSKRIDSLEQSMREMGNKMLVLEDRMDGVVASAHAISNARPVLSSAGQYGVGVGVGAAGSKQAIAVGGAMQFSENWSGSMSVNYETKGKRSSDQFSAGVGAQYVF
ncbi:YadA-like family protein [Vibrio sp. HN007]|uniref:YadA-like family protein n=1 Tax=Vibrio iocasae TaxID=3098914 RepID=UPI0035D51C89